MLIVSPAAAERAPLNGASKELFDACMELGRGAERRIILDRLETARKGVEPGPLLESIEAAIHDLHLAVEEEAKPPPAGEIELLVWKLRDEALPHEGTGPWFQLKEKGEAALPALVAALGDRTLTRIYAAGLSVQRRGDVAFGLVQIISGCLFNLPLEGNVYSSKDQAARAQLARDWWEATRDKSAADRIRWTLARIEDPYARVPMLQGLNDLGFREEAVLLLREGYDGSKDLRRNSAQLYANALAKMGDLSPLNDIYVALRSDWSNGVEEGAWSESFLYLARHGGLREMELLHQMIRAEHGGDASSFRCWPLIFRSDSQNRMAVPLLAIYLEATRSMGFIDRPARSVSSSEVAVGMIQRLAGVNFGYVSVNCSEEEALQAIEKARRWWADEGERKYGFARMRNQAWKQEWDGLSSKEQARIEQWVAALGDHEFAVRQKGAEALRESGDRAAWRLQQVLEENSDAEVRAGARQILDEIRLR